MHSPESNEPELTSQQVIDALRAARVRGDDSTESSLQVLQRWVAHERSKLPDTPEGEIALRRKHAHILGEAGFPRLGIELLETTLAKHSALLQGNEHLRHLIDIDINDIDSMREINEDIRAIEGGWKKVLLNPEQ